MKYELATVLERLDYNQGDVLQLAGYYGGRQPLAFVAPEVREATKDRLSSVVVNWPRLTVDAVAERLSVIGFTVNDRALPGVWRDWRMTGLDVSSQTVETEALIAGRSYVLVWADGRGRPVASVESAATTYVLHDPGTRERVAAVKRWQESADLAHLVYFQRDRVSRYTAGSIAAPANAWTLTEVMPNPFGVVPVVPFINRARHSVEDGESEMSDVLPLADAINKLTTDLMVASEFSALPRRWATGVQLPEAVDADGNPTGEVDTKEAFSLIANRVWMVEDPTARMGQFPEAQLSGFTNALAALTQSLGALSGLPPHYLGLHGDQPASADAIRSAEASLVARVRRAQRQFGASYAEVIRLVSAVSTGRWDTSLDAVEVQWADPETRTDAQTADAVTKLYAAGLLPYDAAMTRLGYKPDQIRQMRDQRRTDAIEQAAWGMGARVAA